ncbi:MAG: mechanosensitive ion channel [Thermoplasmatota archaeon]
MTSPISDALYNAGLKLGGFGEPFVQLEESFWNLIPGLIFFLVILLIGYMVSKFIAGLVKKILEKIGFEKAMKRVKIEQHFRSIGFENVSHFVSIFVFWFIFLIFLQMGIGYLQANAITNLLEPIILLIPRALIAALLVVIGLYIGTVVADILKKILDKSGLQKTVQPIDKQIASMGYSLFSILALIVKVWIILIFVGIAVDILQIAILTQFIQPIILFFPNVIVAFFVILIGLVVADYVVNAIKNWLDKTPIGKKLKKADKSSDKGGFSILAIALMLVKAWILLIFVQIALDILTIDILTTVLNPVILYFPRLLIAMILIIIGLIVVDIILKITHKLLTELGAKKFIDPVDKMLKKPGIIMKFIDFLITITVMLVFINMAVAVLDITQITTLINTVILYIPNLFAAAIILLIGLWFAGWLSEKILAMSKENELPFPSLIANAVKFVVMFLVITMALAQVRFEIPILYIAFAIAFGSVMIGLGAGFAYGMKDISANMAGYIQVNEIVTKGDTIKVGEYAGVVEKVTRYTTVIKDKKGQQHAIPNTYLVKNTISK